MSATPPPDPLQRVRHELVAAAARANRRRVRRRRIVLLAILPVTLLTASAGAAAIGGFSTGVPAVDRLLATEGGADDATDPRLGTGDASEPLRLPDAADGRGAALVAYVSRNGLICRAQGDFRRSDGAPRGSSGGGCWDPRGLARGLARMQAICCASMLNADRRIYDGFADGDVVALRFRMADGATIAARLTKPWTPDLPGARALRLFAVVDERDIDVGTDGLQPDEVPRLNLRYRVEADLRDGRTVDILVP